MYKRQDFDSDGTGDNADTDDDADGTLDVNDAFAYDICADTGYRQRRTTRHLDSWMHIHASARYR